MGGIFIPIELVTVQRRSAGAPQRVISTIYRVMDTDDGSIVDDFKTKEDAQACISILAMSPP